MKLNDSCVFWYVCCLWVLNLYYSIVLSLFSKLLWYYTLLLWHCTSYNTISVNLFIYEPVSEIYLNIKHSCNSCELQMLLPFNCLLYWLKLMVVSSIVVTAYSPCNFFYFCVVTKKAIPIVWRKSKHVKLANKCSHHTRV